MHGNGFDCIIAVSGGKDSQYQVYVMIEKMGMHPLLVTVEDNFPMTEAGKHKLIIGDVTTIVLSLVMKSIGLKNVTPLICDWRNLKTGLWIKELSSIPDRKVGRAAAGRNF